MAIDPNIALGFKNPQIQIQNPVTQYAQAQELGLNALRMKEAQQTMETRNMLRALDPNSPDYVSQVSRVDPKLGLELQKGRTQARTAEIEQRTKLGGLLKNYANQVVANPTLQTAMDVVMRFGRDTGEDMSSELDKLRTLGDNPDAIRKWGMGYAMTADQILGQTTLSASQRAQLAQSESQFQRSQAKPVFSPDYGGFVVPPSANAPQGSFVPVAGPTGAPLQSNKPLTEGQAKGVGFALRAKEADEILKTVGKGGEVQPGVIKRVLESTPFIGEGLGTTFNWTQSAAQQQVEQAQRNFVNAVLRQESGAVINEDEFNNAKKQYFPQPGDSEKVIKQKEQARKTTIKALETQAGPGLARAGAAATATGGGNTVTIPGGKVLTFPTPEAAAAYRQAAGL